MDLVWCEELNNMFQEEADKDQKIFDFLEKRKQKKKKKPKAKSSTGKSVGKV